MFDRPFNILERSNTCHPELADEVREIRSDREVLCQLAKLKKAFLEQNDCLCHGDLATDNVMAVGDQFRVRHWLNNGSEAYHQGRRKLVY